jgi:hypothetical protein
LELKSKPEQFEEYQEESRAARRKQLKITAEHDQLLKLISPAARGKIYGEKSKEEI